MSDAIAIQALAHVYLPGTPMATQALAGAAQNGKLIAYDAGHNDCPPDWGLFWRDVGLFLRDAKVLPR